MCFCISESRVFLLNFFCLFGFVIYLFGFQESSFSGFKGTSSQTLWGNWDSVAQLAFFEITFTQPSVNAALT